ncbi:thiamine-phosphate kinase [Nanchangia anserum]|uniref:thiamine-phosphate kinase n=1 Tax=Nanchangia anserum TaxID=2692125 RepID=UPI001D103317|nr:thiamine-phosphate kinase [Nanchangia anserum]
MDASELGEDGVLALISDVLTSAPTTIVGPGDDCAVLEVTGPVVATTDVLVEGEHFVQDWSSPYDIGERAAAQNLADVAAMGAHPSALVVGMALPGHAAGEWVRECARGLADRARAIGAGIEGGDLTRSRGGIVISVTALGDLRGRTPVLRSGARVGDAIVIAGTLGMSRTGFELYDAGRMTPTGLAEEATSEKPVRELAEACAAVFRAPNPPLHTAIGAAARLHAMMDVSDGLARDCQRIARASGVSMCLDSTLLAPDCQRVAPLDELCRSTAWSRVLRGGEDHAFVATCAPDAIPTGFRIIGSVESASGIDVSVDSQPLTGPLGWESLA